MFVSLKCEFNNGKNKLAIDLVYDELYFIDLVTKDVKKLNKEDTKVWLKEFTSFSNKEFGKETILIESNPFNFKDTICINIEFTDHQIDYRCYFGDLIKVFLDINLFKTIPFYLSIKSYEEEIIVDLFNSLIKISNDEYPTITKIYECESDVVDIMKEIDYKCINPNDGTFYTVTIKCLNETITEDFEWLDTESNKLLKLIKDVITELEFEKGRSMLDYFDERHKENIQKS